MNKKMKLQRSYCEWHLVDEDGKIFLNITDTDIGYCETAKELLEAIDNIWGEAFEAILEDKEFNGIKTEYIDDDWKFIVAKRLFEHYGYDTTFLNRTEKFRDETLSFGYVFEDLGILDWYILLEVALQS